MSGGFGERRVCLLLMLPRGEMRASCRGAGIRHCIDKVNFGGDIEVVPVVAY